MLTRTQRTTEGQRGGTVARHAHHRDSTVAVRVALAGVSFVSFVSLIAAFVSSVPGRVEAARPGAIRGRVELRRPAAPIERRPGVADLGTPAARGAPNLLRSVVYLESAPRGAFEISEGGHAVMDQRNETFVPHVLAIMTGTTVDFPNSDRFYHNFFSLSKTRPFDLGRYAAGSSRPIRFDRPGIVRVFCDIHSHMNAFILVFSHPFFAMTDAEGRYRIENVPPGTYGVIAWNEGTSSETRPITVADGGVAELDFTLR
jgi:plastocyanin